MPEYSVVFLLSLPRSGSTLLQKILGSNESVYTRSEPWIMLYPAYSLKKSGMIAEYNIKLANRAADDFMEGLPEKGLYIKSLNKAYRSLYESYLRKHDKTHFLDKTPRYSLIIDELSQIFPDAKQIVLIRDPLSVLNSLIPRKSDWRDLRENRVDMINALDNLVDTVCNPTKLQCIVKYEDFIVDPAGECKRICAHIGVSYVDEMLSAYLDKTEKWGFGDQKIYDSPTIDQSRVAPWKRHLDNPQYWRVFHDYLELIGAEKYGQLGYEYEKTREYLMQNVPGPDYKYVLQNTISLDELLNTSSQCQDECAGVARGVQPGDHDQPMPVQLKKTNLLQFILMKLSRYFRATASLLEKASHRSYVK